MQRGSPPPPPSSHRFLYGGRPSRGCLLGAAPRSLLWDPTSSPWRCPVCSQPSPSSTTCTLTRASPRSERATSPRQKSRYSGVTPPLFIRRSTPNQRLGLLSSGHHQNSARGAAWHRLSLEPHPWTTNGRREGGRTRRKQPCGTTQPDPYNHKATTSPSCSLGRVWTAFGLRWCAPVVAWRRRWPSEAF